MAELAIRPETEPASFSVPRPPSAAGHGVAFIELTGVADSTTHVTRRDLSPLQIPVKIDTAAKQVSVIEVPQAEFTIASAQSKKRRLKFLSGNSTEVVLEGDDDEFEPKSNATVKARWISSAASVSTIGFADLKPESWNKLAINADMIANNPLPKWQVPLRVSDDYRKGEADKDDESELQKHQMDFMSKIASEIRQQLTAFQPIEPIDSLVKWRTHRNKLVAEQQLFLSLNDPESHYLEVMELRKQIAHSNEQIEVLEDVNRLSLLD